MSSIEMCHSNKQHSTFDFEGLEESLVDNNDDEEDDEDFIENDIVDPMTIGLGGPNIGGIDSSGIIFDHTLVLVRDALIRDSANRTEDDIEIIVRFLSAINSNHDHMTRKRLAPHFVLAEIESRDTRVLTHDEKLDAYCIVAAGSLRHVIPCGDELFSDSLGSPVDDCDETSELHQHHQRVRYLHIGDEFGAHLNDRVVYGEIFTNENFVWVLCVPHVIFDQICGEKAFKTIKDEVTGNVIEMRTNCYLQLTEDTLNENVNCKVRINENYQSDLNNSKSMSSNISSQSHHGSANDYSQHVLVETNSSTLTAPNASALPPKTLSLPSSNKTIIQPNSDNNELIRATKERLFELVLNSDPSEIFIEDFLLTFRIWSEKELSPSKDSVIMNDLMNRICSNIRAGIHVENCVRVVLLWMANHFQDFQSENRYLMEEFENVLKEKSLKTQLRLFHMHLSAKSMERRVTITRSDRNSALPFQLVGGYECSARLFIGEIVSPTESGSSPQHQLAIDLRPGDRVISINGVDCHVMPIGRAYELCRSSTHLSLQVKYDPHLFNALIEGRYENKRQIVETFPINNRLSNTSSTNIGSSSPGNLNSLSNIKEVNVNSGKTNKENSTGHMWKQKVRSLVSMTTNQLINSTSNILNNSSSHQSLAAGSANGGNGQLMNTSVSNSSISSSTNANTNTAAALSTQPSQSTHPRILSYEIPEIIKIYLFENNDCRFLPIHSSTTARECIQLALREFQLTSNYSSRDFALYEYSVLFNNSNNLTDDASVASSTMVKRLNDGTSDLVNNLGLNSRFYLKLVVPPKESNGSGNNLTDSDIAKEIIKDYSNNSLLTLNANAIARELTGRDFRLFCKIEAQQFVYDLAYNDPNGSSHDNSSVIFERTKELQEFERKTNEEMFWSISRVLEEKRSLTKRVKVIKQLIRIANVAMKLNNFNTLFAILSGLSHSSVGRLRNCWDKVPSKDMKKLAKLKQIMDPSRNFYNFRQKLLEILRQNNGAFIIIPFFPLVKKDLSFIWLANQTYVNSKEPQTPSSPSDSCPSSSAKGEMLVNWEKMRLLSEKIREIQKMTNTTSLAVAAVNGMNPNGSSMIASPSVANEPVDPNLLFRIFADTTMAEDPRTFSHKRLWENQRMMKRVQVFLDETYGSVTSDEQELLSRSHSCELPQTPNSSHATTRSSIASTMSSNSQLSHPSPTPSSASSSSNSLSMHSDGLPGGHQMLAHRPTRPRFGATSPNQLRKLLALSDGSVVVPHNNNNHNQTHSNVVQSSSGNSTISNSHNLPQQTSHHHHPFSSHHRSSTSSLNSSLSSNSTSYYNNLYGCNPSTSSYSMMNSGGGGGVSGQMSYPNGNIGNNNQYHHHQSQQMQQHQKMLQQPHSNLHHLQQTSTYTRDNGCCTLPANVSMPQCCSVPQSGPLYPNQSYCSCCGPNSSATLRSSIMMMPPPQTSGLMHPGCPCAPNHQTTQTSRQRSIKQVLPVESSSVTSFRRLEQYQQMTRYREIRTTNTIASGNNNSGNSSSKPSNSRRPQCPDYDTTMQRICGGTTSITINGNSQTSTSISNQNNSSNNNQNKWNTQH